MTDMAYCSAPDCVRETRGNREHCAMHAKRKQRKSPLDAPPAERLSPADALAAAAARYADCDSEDDRAFDRARESLRHAATRYAGAKVREEIARRTSERIRAGLDRARKSGRRLGRPPRVHGDVRLAELVRELGSAAVAARLGCSERTVRRALSRIRTAA